jgi:DNA-nicking Smr family endonuclease
MQRNKLGLSDLKVLRKQTLEQPASRPQSIARKRSPFLPPSPRSATPAGAVPPAPSRPLPGPAPGPARPTSPYIPIRPDPASVLPEEDRRLFLQAVRHVDRIPDPGRVVLPPVPPAPRPILEERRKWAAGEQDTKGGRKRARDTEARARGNEIRRPLSDTYAPAGSQHDDTRYLRAGHGTDVLRGLSQGKWPIGASLDLHGSTLEQARERLDRFLTSCLDHDVKCVRIVHGKGLGSKNGDAVLKTAVRRWLTQVGEVVAYVECSEPDGGSGAVQVLLK